jgi:hypothetical protein
MTKYMHARSYVFRVFTCFGNPRHVITSRNSRQPVQRKYRSKSNGSGAPLEQKMIEGLFFWFPFFVRNLFWFIDIFLEGQYFLFFRKIIIKIIHWIIPPGALLSLPACAGAPHHIPVSTAYHPYTYKAHEKRLGCTWRLIMGAWRWVPIGTAR